MENKLHILLCEDEESLGMLVREYLQAKGYDAELYLDGEAGYKAFVKGEYDMCLCATSWAASCLIRRGSCSPSATSQPS